MAENQSIGADVHAFFLRRADDDAAWGYLMLDVLF